jgi:hypothetical protein
MGSYLFNRGGRPNLGQNNLCIFNEPGTIASAIGGLAISARLLHLFLPWHDQSLDP